MAVKGNGHPKIEMWPTTKPVGYARNARVVPEPAIAKVAASIHEFGFRSPILVDGEGVIIAGHTRLLAAQRLGHERVPVIICSGLSPAQIKAYRLADNRTAQETSWDLDLLGIELEELRGLDFDLDLTAFDKDELADLLAAEGCGGGLTNEDAAPEPPEAPVSRPGDVWLLGRHRLLCGDSTASTDVVLLMDGKRAVLMATDPPYLVDYDGGNHLTTKGGGPAKATPRPSEWDHYIDPTTGADFYEAFLRTALEHALIESAAIYQWFAIMRSELVWAAWRALDLLPHQVLIWKKTRSLLTHAHYMWDYEPFVYGWPQGHMPKRRPPADARTVWEIDSKVEDGAGSIHPTMKPVETIRRCITYHTKPGDLIYEPFAGSGTAIIAAENTGRLCYAIEQSPAFVDAAVARWEAYAGEDATLDDGGYTFEQVALDRA